MVLCFLIEEFLCRIGCPSHFHGPICRMQPQSFRTLGWLGIVFENSLYFRTRNGFLTWKFIFGKGLRCFQKFVMCFKKSWNIYKKMFYKFLHCMQIGWCLYGDHVFCGWILNKNFVSKNIWEPFLKMLPNRPPCFSHSLLSSMQRENP